MNRDHLELLRSEGWRELLTELIVPFALGDLTWEMLGEDVLEVGPGPGLTTDLIRDRVPKLTVLELDEHLAAELRNRLSGAVAVDQGDATAMPYPDGRFDAVVMFTMCHHIPSAALQDRMFSESRRVLRAGGVLVANDSVASPELAALHDGDVYCPVDPAQLDHRLRAAGFERIHVRANDFGWAAQGYAP